MADVTSQVTTNLVINQTGGAVTTAREHAKALRDVSTAAKDAQREVAKMGALQVQAAMRQNQVVMQGVQQLKAAGVPVGGAAAGATSNNGIVQGLGAVGQAGLARFGLGGLTGAMGAAGGMAAATAAIQGMVRLTQARAQAASLNGMPIDAATRRQLQVEAFDPFGIAKSARELAQARMTGQYISLEQQMNIQRSRMGIAGSAALALGGMGFERNVAMSRAGAAGSIPFVGIGSFDRSTAAGQQMFREAQQRLASQNQVVLAQREVAAMEAANIKQRKTLVDADAKLQKAFHGRADAQKLVDLYDTGLAQLGQRRSGPGTVDALERMRFKKATALEFQQNADIRVNQALEQRRQAIEQQTEIGRQQAAARLGLSRAQIGLGQAELGILEQRESMASGAATRFGAMGKGMRMQAVRLAEFANRVGIGRMTPYQIGLLQQVDPVEMQKRLEKFGESTPEFQRMRELGFQSFRQGPLANIREQQSQVINELQQKMQQSEGEFLKALGDVISRSMENLTKQMRAEMTAAEQRIQTQFKQQWNKPR